MNQSLRLAICDTQGQLFELAGKRGYASEDFIKSFMFSKTAKDLDLEFHHLQWAGKEYIFSCFLDETRDELTKSNEVYDKETLYWIGYIYRYWQLYAHESSKEIYKQAPAKKMAAAYLMYHSMSPEMAIDRFKNSGVDKKLL